MIMIAVPLGLTRLQHSKTRKLEAAVLYTDRCFPVAYSSVKALNDD